MNRDELLLTIENNLKQANIEPERIIVRQDPYGGWQIAVVAEGFRDIPQKKRRQTVLEKIEETIEWIELITPEEREWIGALPGDIQIEDLPLWPETLAKGALENSSEVVFPSDLDRRYLPPDLLQLFIRFVEESDAQPHLPIQHIFCQQIGARLSVSIWTWKLRVLPRYLPAKTKSALIKVLCPCLWNLIREKNQIFLPI